MRTAGLGLLALVLLSACGGPGGSSSPGSGTSTSSAPATPSAPEPAPRRVVLYGDGLLDGDGLDDSSSLPVLLSAARPDLQVIDMSLGHERSAQVLERIRQPGTAHASEVVVWAGTYDTAQRTPASGVAANVGMMLDALSGTTVAVLLPIDPWTGGDATAYAAPVRAIAASHHARVIDPAQALASVAPALDANQNLTARADAAVEQLLDATLERAPGAPSTARRRVLLAGDSLVNGSGLPDAQSLPVLIASSRADLDVVDEGVGGTTTTDILSRLRQLRSVHADEVVLWVGSDDADISMPVAMYAQQLAGIVDALSPARFVMVTPIPDYSANPDAVPPYVQAARTLAGARGLAVVDADAMVERSDYLDDGVHLGASAERRVAAALVNAL